MPTLFGVQDVPALSLITRHSPLFLALANEAPNVSMEKISDDTPAMIGLANEAAIDSDGWALISPYGDFPHEAGIQRVTREAAEAMVRDFKYVWKKFKRAAVGPSVYEGHPDNPEHKTLVFNGKSNLALANQCERGILADMEARDNGLWAKLALNESGGNAVNSGKEFLSPNWIVKSLPEENGRKVFMPMRVLSAGLTRNPNIPGLSLANQKPSNPMRNKLIALLALANTAPDEDIVNAVTTATTAAARIPALEADLSAANTRNQTALANEQASASRATEQIGIYKGAFQTERGARIADHLGAALAAGRITPPEKMVWETALANEATFATKLQELDNLAPRIKTESRTEHLGDRKETALANSTKSKQARFAEMVSRKRQETGLNYDAAFAAVEAENPNFWA